MRDLIKETKYSVTTVRIVSLDPNKLISSPRLVPLMLVMVDGELQNLDFFHMFSLNLAPVLSSGFFT